MKQPKISEHTHQVQVLLWANLMAKRKYPMLRWLYAVPNGGARHPVVAAKLKAEGVKPGVPDLCLPYPKMMEVQLGQPLYNVCGLYIEMKTLTPKGRLSDDQKEWIAYLKGVGYKVVVCWNADEAIQAIGEYLNGS